MKFVDFACAFLLLEPVTATAAPVQWVSGSGANGHYYEFVGFDSGTGTWQEALALAGSRSYSGLSGYLATVGSNEENQFLTAISSSIGYLGATDEAEEGTWSWVTGPEAGQVFYKNGQVVNGGYANWNYGEPNNYFGVENFLHTNFGQPTGWNDIWYGGISGSYVTTGFFVEYGTAAVPEPATWALMLSGFGLLGAALRGRKRALNAAGQAAI